MTEPPSNGVDMPIVLGAGIGGAIVVVAVIVVVVFVLRGKTTKRKVRYQANSVAYGHQVQLADVTGHRVGSSTFSQGQ